MRFVACAAIVLTACGGKAPGGQAPALSITPPQVEVQTGAAVKFSANQPAAWSLAEGSAGGAISADGTYLAPNMSGTVHVMARTGSESAIAVVRVISNIQVAVDPPAATLGPGMTSRFHATVSGAANTAVAWSIAEGSAGGTIYPEGVYIAPLAEGTWHVVAASVADPARSATATITISGAVMAIDPPAATVAAGDRI